MSAKKKSTARKTAAKKATAKKTAAKKATAKKATAKKRTAKKASKKTTTKKAVAKKPAKKKVAKKKPAPKKAARKTAKKPSSRIAKKKSSVRKKVGSAKPKKSKSGSTDPQPVADGRGMPWIPISAGYSVVPKDDRMLGLVVVFGGGITGMTAAHELAERGFQVVVMEKRQALNRFGHQSLAIGGMARSQYLRVPFEAGAKWWDQSELDGRGTEWPALPAEEVGPRSNGGFFVIVPDPNEPLPPPAQEALRKHIKRLKPWTTPEKNQGRSCPFLIVTRMTPRAPAEVQTARRAARQRLDAVRDFLVHECGVEHEDVDVLVVTSEVSIRSEEHQLGHPPEDQPWVGVRLDQSILPGEHGFRFFPSYYRHMFDTMHRIPLQMANGHLTPGTVYDNLRSAKIEAFATRGHLPVITTRSADLSVTEQLHAMVLQMQNGEYDPLDIQQFLGRLMRFMCACPERRSREYNEISWWQFIAAYDPTLGVELLRYSKEFEETVKFSGKVLAAFDADRGDAHTNGDTYVQLFLSTVYKNQSNAVDGTLNAPTSEALFEPWRDHLEALGVTFMPAQLEHLEYDRKQDKVVPFVMYGSEDGQSPGVAMVMPVDADYYVMATDVVTAEEVSKDLPPVGVPGGLRGYTTVLYPGPNAPREHPIRYRKPLEEPGLTGWDRLQTLAGIQYYFASDFKLVFGHIYFTDAHWALSSITEPIFWVRRPSLSEDGYTSLLSVDIGSWRADGSPFVGDRPAWDCTQMEIGEEVWRQIQQSLKAIELGTRRGQIAMPQPTWFHVDSSIVFGSDGKPWKNLTPFLVPMVGDWHNRPGTEPWVPTGPPLVGGNQPEGVWQADHGGYPVHWNQLVYAGTYLKTTTRMTTMESANESARHAVNAILDHYVWTVGTEDFVEATLSTLDDVEVEKPRLRNPMDAHVAGDPDLAGLDHAEDDSAFLGGVVSDAQRALGNSGAPVTSGTPGEQSPIFPTTWIGDYCQIWNPESYEPPDLRPLRNLDKAFFDAGLPHVFDVLGLDPHGQTARAAHAAAGGAPRDVQQWLHAVARASASAPMDPAQRPPSGARESAGPPQPPTHSGFHFNPLDPLGLGRMSRDWMAHVQEHLIRAGQLAGASAAQSQAAGMDMLLGLDATGLAGWEKFLEFVEAMGAGQRDADRAQAEVLEVLERIRRELERELFGGGQAGTTDPA